MPDCKTLRRLAVSIAIMAAIIGQQWLFADGPQNSGKKRVLPPKWDQRTLDKFFTDARGALEGERPNFGDGASVATAKAPNGGAPNPANPGAADSSALPSGEFAWSKLISADSLTDEIKSYQTLLKDDVKSLSQFKAEGFKRARQDFSVLAVEFAVIGEYDGEVRWKSQALAARDLFAQAGANCKANTDQVFGGARARAEDLAALVRGETLPSPSAAPETKTQWATLTLRPFLMRRLELAQEKRLAVWTSNPAEFSKNVDAIYRESQMIAVIAEVIQREGFDFVDASDYKGFAHDLQKHALEIADAAKAKNGDAARTAAGSLVKACSNCHGAYK